MKAYVLTTGLVFALIAIAHTWEMIDRARVFASDAVVIGLSGGLAAWAGWLAKRR